MAAEKFDSGEPVSDGALPAYDPASELVGALTDLCRFPSGVEGIHEIGQRIDTAVGLVALPPIAPDSTEGIAKAWQAHLNGNRKAFKHMHQSERDLARRVMQDAVASEAIADENLGAVAEAVTQLLVATQFTGAGRHAREKSEHLVAGWLRSYGEQHPAHGGRVLAALDGWVALRNQGGQQTAA